jgi:hypothetical protein
MAQTSIQKRFSRRYPASHAFQRGVSEIDCSMQACESAAVLEAGAAIRKVRKASAACLAAGISGC